MFDQFTLGIEEEFQIVDPQSRELRSHVVEILEEGTMLLGEQIKPEMIQSMVEVGTGVCKNIQEARTDIPDHFDSYGSFQRYVELLIKTSCIDNGKKIWWDIRPHPFFPTLEFRVCDIPTRVDDTIAIAALFQAIVAKLNLLIEKNLGFRLYRRMLIQENKWRAVRYGLDGKMIDFGKQKEVPVRDLILELLEFVDDVLDPLGSRQEVEHIHTILQRGTSADEQLEIYRQTNDLNAVVDKLAERTLENVPVTSQVDLTPST
ncbi:MAG: hypothetical protein LC775_20530, partial [Acidobacteria bacterium]|nr:hypothetical protein [Acidobacteriota bacterium]